MTKRNQILNPVFIASLLILLLNDLCLKEAYTNQLTGKLSDFAGLIVFPVFMSFIFPAFKKWIVIVTGILFVIWKTPAVSPIIDSLNQVLPFQIRRTIDYSDYMALLVLPFAHKITNKDQNQIFTSQKLLRIAKTGIASVSFFAICATTMPRVYEMPKGTIYIGKAYTIKKPKAEIIERIRTLGYNVDQYDDLADSTSTMKYSPPRMPYYQTDNIVIYNDNSVPIDTILNVKYTMYEPGKNRTRIEILNVTLSKDGNIQRWQTLKFLRKQYKKAMKKQLINQIK